MDLPFSITEHHLDVSGFCPRNGGLTIIHLTDFHAGNAATEPVLLQAVEWTSSQFPDYVVLTGDYIDKHDSQVTDAARILAGLTAKRGLFATIGNHDYRSKRSPVDLALCRLGIRVLDNEALELESGLWLAGIDDLTDGGGNVAVAFAGIPADTGILLLSHNPNALDHVPGDREVTVLAGHTHGGQIRVAFPSQNLVCRWKLGTRYVEGWYHRGRSRLYVNRGLGVTGRPPLNRRFRCPPEIAIFHIK